MPMSKTDEKAFNSVMSDYEASRDKFEKKHKTFNEIEDLFLGYIDPKKQPWDSAVAMPFAYQSVMQYLSHLYSRLPRGRYQPMESDDIERAELNNQLVKYQLSNPKQDFLAKMKMGGLETALFGFKFYTLHWRYERQNTKDGEKRVLWDAPFLRPIYVYDAFPDPAANDVNDMRWFSHIDYVSIDELEATNKMHGGISRYKNLGILKEKIEEAKKSDSSVERRRAHMDSIRGLGGIKNKYNKIKVIKYLSRDRFITIAPDWNVVIEDREGYEHGDLPVHMMRNTLYDNQLLPIGEIEPVIPMHRAANDILNQHMTMMVRSLYQMTKVRSSAAKKYADTWKLDVGQMWVVDEMDDVQQFGFQDTTSPTFQAAINLFRDEINRSNGAFDVITRLEGGNERTATEVAQAGEEQNARRREKEANIDVFITRLMTQWAQLNHEFITKEQVVRVVGDDAMKKLDKLFGEDENGLVALTDTGKQRFTQAEDKSFGLLRVSKDDIAGSFDFIVDAGSMVGDNTAKEQKNLMEALQLVKQFEGQLQAEDIKVNYRPLLEKIFRSLDVNNVDEILTTPQEATPQEQDLEPDPLDSLLGGQGMPEQMPQATLGQMPAQGMPQGVPPLQGQMPIMPQQPGMF